MGKQLIFSAIVSAVVLAVAVMVNNSQVKKGGRGILNGGK